MKKIKKRRKAFDTPSNFPQSRTIAGKTMGTYLKYRDQLLDNISKIKLEPRKEKHMRRDSNHRNKTGSPADMPFDDGHNKITVLNQNKTMKYGNIENPPGKQVIGDSVIAPYTSHRTNIETGRPSTKGIKMVEKVNGKMKIVLMDTKLYDVSNVTTPFIPRNLLDHAHGFNSKKMWVMPGAACPGYRDLFETVFQTKVVSTMLPRLTDGTAQNADERRLLSVKNFTTEISFVNENSSLPIKMKFHIVRAKNSIVKNDNTNTDTVGGFQSIIKDLRDKVFSNPVGNPKGTIGLRYMHTDPSIIGPLETVAVANSDNYRRSALIVDMEPRAYLKQSAYFRDKFEIVKTVSRTLKTNDVWRIKHKQHMGSGIDMDAARVHYLDINQDLTLDAPVAARLGNDEPLTYFYIVESMGTSVTAVVGDTNTLNVLTPSIYQGTSPGQYHTEFRTYIEYLIPGNNANVDVAIGGLPEGMHARFFKQRDSGRPTEATRQRFITSENIVYNRVDVTAGKAFIPVFTDKSIVGAGFKGLYGNAP